MKCNRYLIIATKNKRTYYIDYEITHHNDSLWKRLKNFHDKNYTLSEPQYCGGDLKVKVGIFEDGIVDIDCWCTKCKSHIHSNLLPDKDDLEEFLQKYVDNLPDGPQTNNKKEIDENNLYRSRI